MNNRQTPIATAVSSAFQEASQTELERQFKEQMDRALEQDKNLPTKSAAEYINEARSQVNELLSITQQMRSSLCTVGEFAPFFDIRFLTEEDATDISKIDQQYMLTIGQQLLADYRKFDQESRTINNRIGGLKTRLDLLAGREENALDEINEIVTLATVIQSDYVSWGEQFQRIMVSAMSDIANHLNPLRPVERRIIL